MFIDGLPMWGFIGDFHDDFVWHRESKAHHYIYTHLKFDIAYNTDSRTGNDYIVAVNVTTDPKIRTDLHEGGVEVDFPHIRNSHIVHFLQISCGTALACGHSRRALAVGKNSPATEHTRQNSLADMIYAMEG